jgi:hypothetical protein
MAPYKALGSRLGSTEPNQDKGAWFHLQAASRNARRAPAPDDARQRTAPELTLLPSPGLSQHLARPSARKWS